MDFVRKVRTASGAVAVQGGVIAGFLLGAPKASPVWGPNVWVDSAGHAAAEPELVRDMYGLAAAQWVRESRIAHYVLVPASDEGLLCAWYRLVFCQQQAHALRPLPDGTPAAPPPNGRWDRTSVEQGQSVQVRVELGGRRII